MIKFDLVLKPFTLKTITFFILSFNENNLHLNFVSQTLQLICFSVPFLPVMTNSVSFLPLMTDSVSFLPVMTDSVSFLPVMTDSVSSSL